jgi:hypothetical protein
MKSSAPRLKDSGPCGKKSAPRGTITDPRVRRSGPIGKKSAPRGTVSAPQMADSAPTPRIYSLPDAILPLRVLPISIPRPKSPHSGPFGRCKGADFPPRLAVRKSGHRRPSGHLGLNLAAVLCSDGPGNANPPVLVGGAEKRSPARWIVTVPPARDRWNLSRRIAPP